MPEPWAAPWCCLASLHSAGRGCLGRAWCPYSGLPRGSSSILPALSYNYRSHLYLGNTSSDYLLPHPHELLHRLRPPCRTRCQHNTKTDTTTDAKADDEPRPYCVNRDAAAYSAPPISTSNVPLQLTLPSWVVPPPAPPCADQLRSAEPACRPVPCPSPLTVPSPYTACRHIPAQ